MSESESRLSITLDSTKAERNAKSLGRELNAVAKSGGALTATVAKLSGVLASAFALDKTIRTVTAFQDSMLRLQATSNATTQAMSQLEKQSRTLGATSRFSAQQAADAQNFLAMAGFKVNEILSATPSVMKFASAASLDLARSADIASNVLGGMQLPVAELDRVMNTMINTAQSANTNVSQMGEALAHAAPLAVTAGISIEQLAASIGVLGDSGIQGGRAGTGLVGVIRQLSLVTPKAEEALSKYGISVEQLDIKANGLEKVLRTLKAANLSTADAIAIFGSESAAAGLIISQNVERMSELSGANEKAAGKLNEVANILDSGLSAAFASVNSAIEEMMLRTGDGGLTSTMKVLAITTAGVISNFNGMGDTFAEANGLSAEFSRNIEIVAGTLSGVMTAGVVLLAANIAIYTKNSIAATAATLSNAAANKAKLATDAIVAQGVLRRAAAEQALSVALLNTAKADFLAARGTGAHALALDAQTAATARAVTATAAYRSAQIGATAATTAAATATRGLAAAFLGPVGIALAIGAAVASMVMFGDETKAARSELALLETSLGDAVIGFNKLTEAQGLRQMAEFEQHSKDLRSEIDYLGQAMLNTASSAKVGFLGVMGGATGEVAEILGMLETQAQNALNGVSVSFDETATAILRSGEMSESTKQHLLQLIDKMEAAQNDSALLSEKMQHLALRLSEAGQAGQEAANGISAADQAMIDAAAANDKYIEGLNKQTQKVLDSRKSQVQLAQEYIAVNKVTGDAASAMLKAAAGLDAVNASGKRTTTTIKKQVDELGNLVNKYNQADKALADYNKGMALADKGLNSGKISLEQYQKVVQGLYADLNKPMWDKFNKGAEEAKKRTQALTDEFTRISDRLDPLSATTRAYAKEVAYLTDNQAALEEQGYNVTGMLTGLEAEYKKNVAATSQWAQMTQRAMDSVDSAFVDMWRNIGSGFESFAASLKNAFKNLLAEMAHMAITRPILMQIGAAIGVGGMSAAGMTGGGGAGGLGSIAQIGNSIYSAFTGWGKAAVSGWQSGGFSGAWQGATSGLFGGGGGGFTAGLQGSYLAPGLAGPTTSGAGGLTGAGASFGNMAAAAPWMAGIGGAFMGYQNSGMKGAAAGGLGGFGGAKAGAALGSLAGPVGTAVGAIAGGILGALGGSKLFGGKWETKSAGIALDVKDGDLRGWDYEYKKKKGGLFSSNKSKTSYSEMDAERLGLFTDAFDATKESVSGLYKELGFDVSDSVLNGLNIGLQHINTMGLSEEKAQEAVAKWFADAAETINSQLDKTLGAELGIDVAGMQELVGNMVAVNAALETIGLESLGANVAGAKLAESLAVVAGGLESFAAISDSYYASFVDDQTKLEQSLKQMRGSFADLEVTTPRTREQFKALVESLDLTTDAGQKTLVGLLSLSDGMSEYYAALENLERSFYASFTPLVEQNRAHLAGLNDEFKTLGQQMPESRNDFIDLVNSFDLTTDAGEDMRRALLQLAPAMNDYYSVLESFSSNLSANIGGLREQIFLDQFDDKGKFDYAKAQADALSAMLPDLTDLGLIEQTTNDIIRLTQTAYGLLDEQGKQQQGAEFIQMLDELEALSRDRAAQAQLEQTEQQAKIMSDAMTTAAERMAASMETAMKNGAADQSAVAAMFDSIGQSIMNQFASMSVSRFGEVT